MEKEKKEILILKEGYDTDYSGQAWSSIKMKGDGLQSGSYTSFLKYLLLMMMVVFVFMIQ